MFINRELVERGFALWCEGEGGGGEERKVTSTPPALREDKTPASSETENQKETES
jgi:hypothetical protein